MIRQANTSDYKDIKEIKSVLAFTTSKLDDSHYKEEIERLGFLIPGEYTLEDHENDLKKIFLVYEDDGKTHGYLRIDEAQEMSKSDKTIWLLPELKDIYFSSPHANIGGIAVSPTAGRHGIGTELLNTAEQKLKEKGISHLFSFVIISPITNIPSKNFHEKNGFQKAAEATAPEMFGLKNFKSTLYYKNLK